MATRLYVGNLPYSATEDTLRRLFGQAGTVESVTMPTDRLTGQPRGFGFIDMATSEEANKAISMLDGQELDGRALRVSIAREREERGGYGGRTSRGPRY